MYCSTATRPSCKNAVKLLIVALQSKQIACMPDLDAWPRRQSFRFKGFPQSELIASVVRTGQSKACRVLKPLSQASRFTAIHQLTMSSMLDTTRKSKQAESMQSRPECLTDVAVKTGRAWISPCNQIDSTNEQFCTGFETHTPLSALLVHAMLMLSFVKPNVGQHSS